MRTGTDIYYMRLAIALAKKGSNRVYPNPQVGCVIVKDGRIAGRGYHEYFGGPHAEINALKEAGERARGSELYVTLEPCGHWGKTPPCSDAIIEAGVRKVFIAMPDPNPKTAGIGVRELRENGIAVVQGILRKDAERLNRGYIRAFRAPKPYVIVKAAMSLDGKIAARTGDSKWITGEKARKYVHKLRSRVDGILVGINTVIMDNPALTSHGQGRDPVRIIIDPGLRIPLNCKVLDGSAPTIVVHSSEKLKRKLDVLRKKHVIPLFIREKKGRMNFKDIFNKLNNMSIYRVLIEGGGTTIAVALGSGLVNEVNFFYAPKLIGGREAPTPVEGHGISRMADAIPIKSMKIRKIGEDILVSGDVIPAKAMDSRFHGNDKRCRE